MRAAEVLLRFGGRKLIRHNQQVFFITHNTAEAMGFQEEGCRLVEFAPRAWSQPHVRSYEVHVNPLLDTYVVEDLFGEKETQHVERDLLLSMLRQRDGVAFDFQHET